jgi:hypothetical protein
MRSTLILAALVAAAAQASPPLDAIGEAGGAALQADAKRALELLKGVDTASLNPRDHKFVVCMRERFDSPRPAAEGKSHTFTGRALSIYRDYWHASLLHPDKRDAEEKKLDASLRRLLDAPKAADLDALVKKRIAAEGKHSLEGRTGHLRELMVWDKQDEKKTHVALPEGEYDVNVAYLDGFESLGWSYYATCGRAATGGWTTDDALYVVVPRYDSLEDEQFRVSFLGHESQHFADKARFKDLKSWELEYRAKLVEVALADKTRAKVLDSFVDDQGDDPEEPHSYADRKILDGLVARLQVASVKDLYNVDLGRLQSAARSILLDDSRRRIARTGYAAPSAYHKL